LRNKIFAVIWVLAICAASAWVIWSAESGRAINANLIDLLPKAERDPVVTDAVTRMNTNFERHLVILVGGREFATAKAGAEHVSARLASSGQFRELRLRQDPDALRHAISFYLPLRFQLLDDLSRHQLHAGDATALERAILMRYYAPQSSINSKLIEKDPLLLLPRFMESRVLDGGGKTELEDGYLTVKSDGKTYIILIGELSSTPFSFTLQERLMPVFKNLRDNLRKRHPGAEFILAGTLPYAAAGTRSALDETSTVGLGSLLGIIVILFAIFRSPRPFFLTLISISLGSLGGFAACLAVFGEVHLLTLIFGASLVGISVDYSLHYFCERFRFSTDWSPTNARRHIFPGITLGLITSIIGFTGLFFAPFPGMQGMAVFSSVGLCIAYGCVVICYPHFTQGLAKPRFELALGWVSSYGALWGRKRDWRVGTIIACLIILAFIGCLRLVASDDIRLLQTPDPEVKVEEARIRSLIGQNLTSQFFLVEGTDAADYLANEEVLTAKLRTYRKSGKLGGYLAVSDFIASPGRQAENRALLAPLIIGEQNSLERIARQIGLLDTTRNAYVSAFLKAERAQPVELRQWLAHPVSKPYRHLWLGESKRGVAGVVRLRGVKELHELRALADPLPFLHFIDPASDISDLFGHYRRQTIWLTIISYGAVMLLLIARYGTVGGLLVMAPPLISAIASLGVLGLLGETISLFNVMALLLVLGIGVDYALFYRETGTDNPATMLAIALSCVTTLLAFGLLALSTTAAIHSFGLTILIGILVAFLLSPMAGWYTGTTPAKDGGIRQ
jgi:predicted exporter